MKFGRIPVQSALNTVLAHTVHLEAGVLRKGTCLSEQDIEMLGVGGVATVIAAQIEQGDVEENTAAARLADAVNPDEDVSFLRNSNAFTGRVNLNSQVPGIVELDASAIHALNRVDPSITLATLAPMTRVGQGTLVGTVKIISYAVSERALSQACALAQRALRVRPVLRRSAGLILTEVPGQKQSLTEKGRKAIAGRLDALGIALEDCRVVPHEDAALSHAIRQLKGDVKLLLTGSATSDMHDTGPEALRQAGGTVARFGMPVDPGNLLFLGEIGGAPFIGLPGCARSPALNGADWVLERIACGVEIRGEDFADMGVGGLLKEIPIRPQLREPKRKG